MPRRFICRDCGREAFDFDALAGGPETCIHCLMAPGWRDDPVLRHLLDPGGRYAEPAPAPPAGPAEPRR